MLQTDWQTGTVVESADAPFRIAESSTGLSGPPPEELWGYLDAAARCIVRFGARRTTVRAIAREAGVERTTLYRNAGPLDQIYRLLLARETHRLIDDITHRLPVGLDGPTTVIETVALAIEAALAHPVLTKLATDEPEMIAEHLLSSLGGIVDATSAPLAAGLDGLVTSGAIAPVDPAATAEWIARFGITTVLAPPHSDIRALLDAVLRPLLEPPT